MYLLDRQLIYSYLKAYLIVLISLLSLWIVVDLFTNIEDFTQHNANLPGVVRHIGLYYGYRMTVIFDRLSEAIALLAAMFTVAWLQRNNELIPMLSAGISTQRVVRPIIISACFMLVLTTLNQELLIPQVSDALYTDRDDPQGQKEVLGPWAYSPNGVHVEAAVGNRKSQSIRSCNITILESMHNSMAEISAQEAHWVPPGQGRYSGGWLLTGTQPAEMPEFKNSQLLEMIDPGKYFLHAPELDFNSLTRNRNWFNLASTLQVYDEMAKPDMTRLSAMAVLFHMRLTRPILGMLLVFLGLSVILRDQNRNVFISAGLCLIVCGLFFGASFLSKHLGSHDILSPALAAWLPVLFFGPLAFVLFDAVHT